MNDSDSSVRSNNSNINRLKKTKKQTLKPIAPGTNALKTYKNKGTVRRGSYRAGVDEADDQYVMSENEGQSSDDNDEVKKLEK